MDAHMRADVALGALIAIVFAACSGSGAVPQRAGPGSTTLSVLSTGPRPAYRLVILGAGLQPNKINNSGIVVGKDNLTNHPFEYKDGHVTELPLLPGDTEGSAFDVNNRGQIVGETQNPDAVSNAFITHCVSMCPQEHAVLYEHGIIENLGSLPPEAVAYPTLLNAALSINDSGEIVGQSGFFFGALRSPSLAIFAPGPLRPILVGGSRVYGVISRVNNSGEIVGYIESDPSSFSVNPFAYPNPIACSLPFVEPNQAIRAINDAGASIIDSGANSVFYCAHGVVTQLPLFVYSGATINARGDIVGFTTAPVSAVYVHGKVYPTNEPVEAGYMLGDYYVSSDLKHKGPAVSISSGEAVLYSNGKYYDLNSLVTNHPGIVVQNPDSINNKREIIGYTITANGVEVGYLLEPK